MAIGLMSLVFVACTGTGAGPSAVQPASPTAQTGSAPPPSTSPPPSELTVYAAASLKAALAKVEVAYEATRPGLDLVVALDSSAALETQIEQGAPVDVFLSADIANPKKLVDAGLADGAPVTFAGNELTIIVPTDDPAGIRSPADLGKVGVTVIAAGDAVPITTYATQLVTNLAMEAGYPPDFAAAYAANVASKEDNVRSVVAKIELGEGDAGIVYVTDAQASDKVATVAVPPDANVLATYDGVVVKASAHAAEARVFLGWLAGPDGQAILGELGFLPPP